MGANGGESPFVVGDNNNNVYRGISIAERRSGFDVASLHPCSTTDVFTVSPGISPSALLASPIDSPPVMLPNAQAQLPSPTTGSMMDFRCGNKVENCDQYLQDTITIAKTEESKNSWEVDHCKTNNRNNNPNHHQQQQKCWEDGFLWRKYGQKQVKGSEFPRSYYRCTSTNCEVTKKVERSLDGQISEIVYKGSHNHPPIRKNEMNMNMNMNITTTAAAAAAVDHHVDLTPTPIPIFDIHEQLDDHMSPQSISNEDDDHQHDPKRRKIRESLGAGPSSHERCGREPKVVLQVESEIDILEDGYRWRKYGQKVVKGNPNPRSYYKCTSPECFVRKHVERAADDIKSVVITYEGKHNHGVPSSRSSSSSSTGAGADKYPSTIRPQSVVHRLQDQRPLYLQERKPILNYNEFMTTPPIYPYPFPRTPPFIMNTNFYHPTTLPSNHIPTHLDPNFHYIPPMQSSSNQPQEIIKEEPKDHESHEEVVYDDHTCLSLPDYGSING